MKSSDILLTFKSDSLTIYRNSENNICVRYSNSEIKEAGGILKTEIGVGEDFESACDDYLEKIRGKEIVFDAYGKDREEVKVLG